MTGTYATFDLPPAPKLTPDQGKERDREWAQKTAGRRRRQRARLRRHAGTLHALTGHTITDIRVEIRDGWYPEAVAILTLDDGAQVEITGRASGYEVDDTAPHLRRRR
ncbi:MAG: hypothetical protein KJ058_00505 [Thermoanaerobaculia bacterium]|nr:hypothetical protein [Thermoanaerobaculia bacterium]